MLEFGAKDTRGVFLRAGRMGVVVIVGEAKMAMRAAIEADCNGEIKRGHMCLTLLTRPFGSRRMYDYLNIHLDGRKHCRVFHFGRCHHSRARQCGMWWRPIVASYLDTLGFNPTAAYGKLHPPKNGNLTKPIMIHLMAGIACPTRNVEHFGRSIVILSRRYASGAMNRQYLLRPLLQIPYEGFCLKDRDGGSCRIAQQEAEMWLKELGFNPNLIDTAFPETHATSSH